MPSPRTILYVSPSSRLLGARRSLLQLVSRLDPRRYRPVVVTKPGGELPQALQEAGITVYPVFMGSWRKGRYFLQRPWKVAALRRIARQEKASLFHCNEFHSNPYAIAAAKPLGLPVLTHMRLSITTRQIKNYGLARADRVLCVSHASRQFFPPSPFWDEKIAVVHNGVDCALFRPPQDKKALRRELDIAPDAFVVGQFGLFSPRKRPHLLLEAVALLKRRHPERPFQVLLVGKAGRSDSPYKESLDRMIAEKGIAEVVRFVPFTADVVPWYQVCDVNTLLSEDEGFGRTIIEAGAVGIPSLGSRVGGIPELIREEETGLLTGAEAQPNEVADKLERFWRNPDFHRQCGEESRRHVEASFSITRHAQAIMELYDQSLGVCTVPEPFAK